MKGPTGAPDSSFIPRKMESSIMGGMGSHHSSTPQPQDPRKDSS